MWPKIAVTSQKRGLQRREGGRAHAAEHINSRSVGFFRTLPPLNQILPGANPSHQCIVTTVRTFFCFFLTEASFPSHSAPAQSRGFTPDVTSNLGGEKNVKKK